VVEYWSDAFNSGMGWGTCPERKSKDRFFAPRFSISLSSLREAFFNNRLVSWNQGSFNKCTYNGGRIQNVNSPLIPLLSKGESSRLRLEPLFVKASPERRRREGQGDFWPERFGNIQRTSNPPTLARKTPAEEKVHFTFSFALRKKPSRSPSTVLRTNGGE
jgi:hypothetical protein